MVSCTFVNESNYKGKRQDLALMSQMNLRIYYMVVLLLFSTVATALPTAKITIKVIDEQGNPVEGAKVGAGFSKPKSGEWGSDISGGTGLSDADGLYVAEGETEPYVGFGAIKEGYYRSGGKFSKFTDTTGVLGFRKYEPWNPTVELVLKKIINPIPMYAVRMLGGDRGDYLTVPVIGRFIGFDLIAKDWMVPHGLGTHSDFLFKVDIARANSYMDYDVTLTVKFPNPGDGLIEYTPDITKGKSTLRLPHHAPISGYENQMIHRYESSPDVMQYPGAGNPEFDTNYFFRVRTELDKDGNVISGLYGKIYGQIKLTKFVANKGAQQEPHILFDYYLNPNNNDTNIEFDPEQNLFKGVPDKLKVSAP